MTPSSLYCHRAAFTNYVALSSPFRVAPIRATLLVASPLSALPLAQNNYRPRDLHEGDEELHRSYKCRHEVCNDVSCSANSFGPTATGAPMPDVNSASIAGPPRDATHTRRSTAASDGMRHEHLAYLPRLNVLEDVALWLKSDRTYKMHICYRYQSRIVPAGIDVAQSSGRSAPPGTSICVGRDAITRSLSCTMSRRVVRRRGPCNGATSFIHRHVEIDHGAKALRSIGMWMSFHGQGTRWSAVSPIGPVDLVDRANARSMCRRRV